MVEQWIAIPGEPDCYEVSNQGRVRSYLAWRDGRRSLEPYVLKQATVRGYQVVNLGRNRQRRVHRLVLLAFRGEPADLEAQGRHLDGNPENNDLSNLAWGSGSDNYQDRHRHGTTNDGTRNGRARLTEQIVREIRSIPGAPATIDADALGLKYGVSASAINHVLYGRTWRHI